MALTKIGVSSIKDTFKTTISGSARGELSSSVHLRQVATTISGSLGANAAVIRSLDRTTISGSIPQALATNSSPTFAAGTITGDLSVGGTLTAQEVHTEFESASILFTSGSTRFGDDTTDTHRVTGSMDISGSLNIPHGNLIVTDKVGFGTNNPSNVLHLEFNDDSDVFTAARITDNSVSGILINNLDTGNGHGGMLKFANKNGDNHTAIAHSQDGNTDASLLFYSMDGGTLAEVMRVDHTHRLGIGNGSPSFKLDVTENAETNVVRFFNDGGDQNRDVMILQGGADAGPGNTRFITFNDGDGGTFGCIQGPAASATAGISFNTTADTSLLTLSGSRVGIGTINPANNLHLHTDNSAEGILLKSTGNTRNNLIFDGNISSAADNIAFIDANWNGTNVARISMFTGTDTSNKDDGRIGFATAAEGTVAERMRIESDGKVGIGITNPADLLDIQGGNLRVRVGGAGAIHLQNDGSNHSQILANNNGGTTTVQLKTSGDSFLNGGHLGLGATPSNPGGMNRQFEVTSTSDVQIAMRATADLSGDARIGDLTWITNHGSNPQVAMIQGRVANGDEDRGQISFHTRNTESGGAPTERMRLTNVGLLGIGTTTPDALLHLREDTNNDRMLHLEHTHSADRLKLGLTHPSQQFVIANNGSHFIFTNESTSTDHFKMAADGTLTATDTSIGAISDEKTKQNIQTYSGSLSVINTLRPVTYEWKSDRKKDGIQRGFIAQEVTSSDAYWVQSSSVDPHEPDWEYLDGTQQLNTISGSRSALVSKLNDKDTLYVSAIQELTQAVRDLRAMITGSTDLGQLKAFVSGSSFV